MPFNRNTFYWSGDQAKLLIGAALFGTWVGLVVFDVKGSDDIVSFIKIALTGLSAHWLTAYQAVPPDPPIHEIPDDDEPINVPTGQTTLEARQ